MTDRKLPLGIRIKTIAMGEDAQRFLTLLPVIKKIDDALDKVSADEWPEKKAFLADEPSDFLTSILRSEVREEILEKAEFYQVPEADIWQNCNLLALQLAEIRDLSVKVRQQEKGNPFDTREREKLVEAHERLSVLATHFAVANFKDVAQKLRQSKLDPTMPDYVTKLAASVIDDREVLVSKIPPLKSKLSDFAKMQQAIDDANDFVVDLRSEVELGRISPNRHILALKEMEINPADCLRKLKEKNPKAFQNGEPISDKNLGETVTAMIRADLTKHKTEIKKYAVPMAARGFSYRGNFFPTKGDDHDPSATNVKLQGDMGWMNRVTEGARAASGMIGL
ncbi:MAG: hypothetical protein LW823_08975 [Rickettsiales bacterium]|jgi:hypothetical protein|nr:hypothetical protein [Rickettsiales bacterium]